MKPAELRQHLIDVDQPMVDMIDGLREEFPGLKVVHIKTDKVQIGTPTDPTRLVEMSYSPPVKPTQEAWYKEVESILQAMRNKNLKKPTRRKK